MMRINTGIVCVLAALTVGACSWGNGSSSSPQPDAAPVVCGDNICAASEAHSCPQDCGSGGGAAVCGNGQCETSKGESATSCPMDCGGSGGSNAAVCGNGTCETGEDSTSCPTDCAGGGSGALDCSDPNTLLACFACVSGGGCVGVDMTSCNACLGGGGGGTTCNNDGVCDPGETSAMCPLDNCP